ncbi:Asp23/Gls24 family envelope stress response protein [Streptomyces sp. NPDC006992]|uniref:Asp23/Gls24 family envelope stress response protein n=1 Tax=unclassified Streptomyces TaxID=2593676 RepID=UPI0033E148E4
MADGNQKDPKNRGTTTVSGTVVAKTAGISAREVSGVHALGGAGARATGAVRRRVGGEGSAAQQGVSVETGEQQAAIDLSVVVEYGEPVHRVAQRVREHVISTVENTTGFEVAEVNIVIPDVALQEDEEGDEESGAASGRSLR